MNNALYQKLFSEAIAGGMQCAGRLANIAHYLLQTSKLDGAMVEFGCNAGRTAALMACVCPEKELWLYDSFQGLPKPTEKDGGQFAEGIMKATSLDVRQFFGGHELKQPQVVSGWFEDISTEQMPEKISFAHLDCDLFESTDVSLYLTLRRMVRGGVIVVDDYGWEVTPGVKAAVSAYEAIIRGSELKLKVLEIDNPNSGQAVILC